MSFYGPSRTTEYHPPGDVCPGHVFATVPGKEVRAGFHVGETVPNVLTGHLHPKLDCPACAPFLAKDPDWQPRLAKAPLTRDEQESIDANKAAAEQRTVTMSQAMAAAFEKFLEAGAQTVEPQPKKTRVRRKNVEPASDGDGETGSGD